MCKKKEFSVKREGNIYGDPGYFRPVGEGAGLNGLQSQGVAWLFVVTGGPREGVLCPELTPTLSQVSSTQLKNISPTAHT